MKRGLDMDKIAKALGAERRGKVSATGGYFGAMQLVADIEARFRVPNSGGRATDPNWTERRLVPLARRNFSGPRPQGGSVVQSGTYGCEHVDDDPLTIKPVTAYEVPPRRRRKA